MVGAFIADSDEESETNDHVVPAAATTAPTRSSDPSLATASTDPVFFQNIYNEQHDAAFDKNHGLKEGLLQDDVEQSSVVTVPDVPFRRTRNGFYHSSLTSVAEGNNSELQKAQTYDNQSELTQVTSPGRIQKAVDPWDVPSSPEVSKRSGQSSKASRTRAKEPVLKNNYQDSTRETVANGGSDAHDDHEGGSRKRRRLAKPHISSQTSNDVTLVPIPFSNDHDREQEVDKTAASSIPLPTLPIESDSPFYMPPPLQVESTQATNINSSTHVARYNNLLLQQQTVYAAGSSGTATNMNTPRSQIPSPRNFSSLAPEDLGGATNTPKREYQTRSRRRNSSPDIISIEPPGLADIAANHGGDVLHEINDIAEPGDGAEDGVSPKPTIHELPVPVQDSQSEQETIEPVIQHKVTEKAKKRRGRPKKPSESDEPQIARPPLSETDEPPITNTRKKRRGRPKKNAPPSPAAAGPSTPTADTIDEVVVTTKQSVGGRPKKSRNDDEIMNKNLSDLGSEKVNVAETVSKGSEGKTEQDGSTSGKKDIDQPLATRGAEGKLDKTKLPREPPATAGSKPLYRVGLSKRSRIAPLLKSLRKP